MRMSKGGDASHPAPLGAKLGENKTTLVLIICTQVIAGTTLLALLSLSLSAPSGRVALMAIVLQSISPVLIPVCVRESAPTHIHSSAKLEQSKNTISWGRHSVYLRG